MLPDHLPPESPMSYLRVSEKSEFVHLQSSVPVRYKFLSKSVPVDSEGIFEGTTRNMSSHGLLLSGKLPGMSWIPGLLMGEILIGINMLFPHLDHPIKGLARVAWIEAFAKGSEKCALGLKYEEIGKESQDEILRFIIKAQIKRG